MKNPDDFKDFIAENNVELPQSPQKPKWTLNPDEDGKDEKYLSGGWHNRIALCLTSPLPNEQDWAFNKLCKISYHPNFYIGYIPGLPQALFDHTLPFFSQLVLSTVPTDFETTQVPDPAFKMTEQTMLISDKMLILLERTLQCLHIIRNLSFMNENCVAFARDLKILEIVAKAIALPNYTFCIEIKQHGLDIFENLSRIIALQGPNDFFLACLKKMIIESDRGLMMGALKCLCNFAGNEANQRIILNIETPLLQRLLQLLLVHDELLINLVIEFLYLYTSISVEAGHRLATCVRFNIISLFFKFIRWKNHGVVVRALSAPTVPQGVDGKAMEHYQAAMWIQKTFEADPNHTLPGNLVYQEYEKYCTTYNLAPILVHELLFLFQKIYSSQAVVPGPPVVVRGLRPKPGIVFGDSHLFPEPHDDLRGIPLTALLVMRNIAKHPDNRGLFAVYEAQFVDYWTDGKFSKLVGAILFELKK